MNVFERRDAKRQLMRSSIIPSWIKFRAAVSELVDSYNKIEEGRSWPAKIEQSGDNSIVILSDRGLAADQFHTLAINIQVSLRDESFSIHAEAEEWHVRQNLTSSKKQFLLVDLILQCNPETGDTWFSWNKEDKKTTPFEAAEQILSQSLLRGRQEF